MDDAVNTNATAAAIDAVRKRWEVIVCGYWTGVRPAILQAILHVHVHVQKRKRGGELPLDFLPNLQSR